MNNNFTDKNNCYRLVFWQDDEEITLDYPLGDFHLAADELDRHDAASLYVIHEGHKALWWANA